MTANTKTPKAKILKKAANQRKNAEKVFHPASRKAGQMARKDLQKGKLLDRERLKARKQSDQANRYAFFHQAVPPEVPRLTLEELHTLVRELWITRYDVELENERAARRKGRPKSKREDELEELKLRDAEEYRTGLEVPDVTDEHNLSLFRQWDSGDPSYLHILRFIRISSEFPDVVQLTRPGRDAKVTSQGESDAGMEEDTSRVAGEEYVPLQRVGSTMLGMDDIPTNA